MLFRLKEVNSVYYLFVVLKFEIYVAIYGV